MHAPGRFAVVGTAAALLLACGGGSSDEADDLDAQDVLARIQVTSPAFGAGEQIPDEFTCAGDDVSPPLAWSHVPDDAAEVALVVDDPDAPGGTFVHWIVVGIDPAVASIEKGEAPPDAVEVPNSAGRAGWSGPCPPEGPAHEYRFTVFALGEASGLDEDAGSEEALEAIRGRAVARGRLSASFER